MCTVKFCSQKNDKSRAQSDAFSKKIQQKNHSVLEKIYPKKLERKIGIYTYFKEGQKSWRTKDWKQRRSEIIKDKCEICGSEETLILQHRSYPQKYSEYLREVTFRRLQVVWSIWKLTIFFNLNGVVVNCSVSN